MIEKVIKRLVDLYHSERESALGFYKSGRTLQSEKKLWGYTDKQIKEHFTIANTSRVESKRIKKEIEYLESIKDKLIMED